MNENDILTYEMDEEDDVMLPTGWAEGDDFFDSDSWTGGDNADSATEVEPEEPETEESEMETTEDDAPAIEQEEDEVEVTEDETDAAPAIEQEPEDAPQKIKVKYQFDHQDVEEEIDLAALPEIMQKARSSERYKARAAQSQEMQGIHEKTKTIAKILGYESPEALIDEVLANARKNERDTLLSKGNSEEIVDDFLSRKYAAAPVVEEAPVETPAPEPAKPTFADQAKELLREFPKLQGTKLPDEVIRAAASGENTLLQAYRAHKEKLDAAETKRIKRENQILKQNAASAVRAPVSGVSRGGDTKVTPEDDFLRGFNSDY